MTTDVERLKESPGQMFTKNGARYHPGDQIISHLNYALGPMGWDWEELDRGYDEMADQVWVRGRLTARFVVEARSGDGYEVVAATKTERGWNDVKRRRDDGSLVNLGDDYKGADTDALKRAARLLGVGLDAWEKGAPANRQEPASAPRRRATQAPATATPDLPLPPRDELLERYASLLDHATTLGYRQSWTGTDPEKHSDVQLSKYGDLLGGFIARSTEAAV